MISKPFSERMATQLELEDVGGVVYSDVLDLWCGKKCSDDKSLYGYGERCGSA